MKLNLGCGDLHLEGYVNVDLRSDVADVEADVTALPYGDETAEEIIALDLLEHFPAARTREVLGEWRRVLRPGGGLTVKVPNMRVLCGYVAEGRAEEAIIRNIYGGHRWGPDGMWDAHHTGWTPEMLHRVLDDCGFRVIDNDGAINMTVTAVKA